MSTKKLLALRAFAMDYHSGQWSRGYKLLSMTYLRLRSKGIGDTPNNKIMDFKLNEARKTDLYRQLVQFWGNKI